MLFKPRNSKATTDSKLFILGNILKQVNNTISSLTNGQ